MFYLLEDNTIIDDKKLNVRVNEYQGKQFLARDSKNRYSLGKIKNQSEKVFDLIDWEQDLVKHSANDLIWHCVILYQTSDISAIDVTAIYKPDSKGNYIKVWERRE